MNMIPFSLPIQHRNNENKQWQQEINASFKNLDDLLNYCEIGEKDKAQFSSDTNFPLRTTRFYADLIEKNNPQDPLLLQVIPQPIEQLKHPDYSTDAVGDLEAIKYPGLIHKYQGRVLISLTSACAIHCRYCFRREFPYSDQIPDLSDNGEILKYIKKHTDVTEVILSGGDPLMLSNAKLKQIFAQLEVISHLKSIRIHSRLISVLPSRINSEFLQIIQESSKNIIIVSHINHANEINTDVKKAFLSLKNINVTLLNQSVLLNHVNNCPAILKQLSITLFEAGVLPYYLHCLDKVNGAAHFDVTRKQAKQIVKQLKSQLSGYLVPRLVEEIAGEASKTHIL